MGSSWSHPLSTSQLEEERGESGSQLRSRLHLEGGQSLGQNCLLRPHASLYPHTITLLWNVRKCVVSASASSLVPWSNQRTGLILLLSRALWHRHLPHQRRESLQICLAALPWALLSLEAPSRPQNPARSCGPSLTPQASWAGRDPIA